MNQLSQIVSTSLLFLLAGALAASKPLDQPVTLQLQILNIQKNNGKVVVEIYKSKADWLQKPVRSMALPADDNIKKAFFDLPAGKYAVSIYQDVNANGKLDQNFLGIPKEPIGFGNNHKPFGKPDFEAALVDCGPASKLQTIKLFSVL